ncbi:7173_t:CDS:1, partial [Gigaspora margarita]
MPHLTTYQKNTKKAYKAKANKFNTNANNSKTENSNDINNFSAYDKAIENNNTTNIVKKCQ